MPQSRSGLLALAITLPLLSLASPAATQTPRAGLDYASAATIRDTCVAWAQQRDMKMALFVLEPHAMPVTLAHMDGVSAGVNDMARWKANAAARSGRATGDTAAFTPPLNAPNAATVGGGVPIYTADGTLLGGVGVSGGKPADDIACATAGIEAAGLKPAKPAAPAQ